MVVPWSRQQAPGCCCLPLPPPLLLLLGSLQGCWQLWRRLSLLLQAVAGRCLTAQPPQTPV
jgi:hypothetical protein